VLLRGGSGSMTQRLGVVTPRDVDSVAITEP
jgi:hypothetical protein